MVIHLGDYVRDAVSVSALFPELPFEYVAGNGDDSERDCARQKILTVASKKILLTHGHLLHVYQGTRALLAEGRKKGCGILLFGHTHVPYNAWEGSCLCVNPGSVAWPRSAAGRTYAVLDIEEGRIHSAIVRL
jgi:putative phosphoesterase